MSYPYIVQGNNIVVVIDNKPYTVAKTHIMYPQLKQAIVAADWDLVKDLILPKEIVIRYAEGHVDIRDGVFYWEGEELHTSLTTRMIDMLKEGFPVKHLALFMEHLMQNPSKRAVDELYGFLEACSIPITDDGCFIAYKRVRNDYTDVRTGTFDNKVGATPKMPRNRVDDNKDRTCSAGLHVCSKEYLAHYPGERIVVCKVNPRDVVSIPTDYHNSKMRVCRYEVVGELDSDRVRDNDVAAIEAKPVVSAPSAVKENNTDFYFGYHIGFNDLAQPKNAWTTAFAEGYAKGQRHLKRGRKAKYVYSGNATMPPKQEYDAAGRKLSMTKDAIRKRAKRQAAAMAKAANNS